MKPLLARCENCGRRVLPWERAMTGNHTGKRCWHHAICLFREALSVMDRRLRVVESELKSMKKEVV